MSSPWMKFYPSDWRADPCLRMCSIGARGLWMEMLCIMHEASPRGTLRINGKQVSLTQLAALTGCPDLSVFLAELEDAGVFSREADGTICSRRMVRDTDKADADRANARRGGNPHLVKAGVTPPVNDEDKAQKPEARYQKPDTREKNLSVPSTERAVRVFCEYASKAGMPVPRKIGPARRRKIEARLREHGDDDWDQACCRLAASAFCRGQNDRGWQADIDFLCQPDTINRLLEGKYDDRPVPNGRGRPREPTMSDVIDDFQRRMNHEAETGPMIDHEAHDAFVRPINALGTGVEDAA